MEKLMLFLVGLFGLVMAYMLFILTPVMFYAEAECLRAGYPKYHVTIGLERYCSTLDGAVTVKVTKQ